MGVVGVGNRWATDVFVRFCGGLVAVFDAILLEDDEEELEYDLEEIRKGRFDLQ